MRHSRFFALSLALAPIAPGARATTCGLDVREWLTAPIAIDPGGDRPVLLDFFATWCLPCREALPHMARLHAAYGDRIQFITVAPEERRAIATFASAHHLPGAIALDTDLAISGRFNVVGLPWLVYLDANGDTRWQGPPAALNEEKLADFLSGDLPAAMPDEASHEPARASREPRHPQRVIFSLSVAEGDPAGRFTESIRIQDDLYDLEYTSADLSELFAKLTGRSRSRVRIEQATPTTRYNVRSSQVTTSLASARKRAAATLAAVVGMEIVEVEEMVPGLVVTHGDPARLPRSTVEEGHLSRAPGSVTATGASMSTILSACETAFGVVLFDETDARDTYDVNIQAGSVEELRESLRSRYGLEAMAGTRKAQLLVIRPLR